MELRRVLCCTAVVGLSACGSPSSVPAISATPTSPTSTASSVATATPGMKLPIACSYLTPSDVSELTGRTPTPEVREAEEALGVAVDGGVVIQSCMYRTADVRISYTLTSFPQSASAHVSPIVAERGGFSVDLGDKAMGIQMSSRGAALTSIEAAKGNYLVKATSDLTDPDAGKRQALQLAQRIVKALP